MKKQFYTEDTKNVELIKLCIDKVVSRIACTMGPRGHLVAIDTGNVVLEVKDGATVARYQSYRNYEGLIANLVIDACQKTEKIVGDGTTATAVLIRDLFDQSQAIMTKSNVHAFKEGMKKAVVDFEKQIKELKVDIVNDGVIDEEALLKVARISANGDNEIATLVSDLVLKVGPSGKIITRQSEHEESYTEHKTGYSLDSGLAAPLFYNSPRGCTFQDPVIVIINERIEFVEQIQKILKAWNNKYGQRSMGENGQQIYTNSKPLVIVAKAVIGDALTLLASNAKRGTHKIAVVTAPKEEDLMEDIQLVTNTGTVFDQLKGVRLDGFRSDDPDFEFGTCDRFFANMEETIFETSLDKEVELFPNEENWHSYIAGDIDTQTRALGDLIKDQVAYLKERVENDADYEHTGKDRIARLLSGVGTLYVGGLTESEKLQNATIFDDVHRACFSAIGSGVVPGAGMAFVKAALNIGSYPAEAHWTQDHIDGYKAVMEACFEPYRQIAGVDVVEDIVENNDGDLRITHDIVKDEWGDFLELGIVDPADVPVVSLRNAVSIAGNLISTKYFQILKDDTEA